MLNSNAYCFFFVFFNRTARPRLRHARDASGTIAPRSIRNISGISAILSDVSPWYLIASIIFPGFTYNVVVFSTGGIVLEPMNIHQGWKNDRIIKRIARDFNRDEIENFFNNVNTTKNPNKTHKSKDRTV